MFLALDENENKVYIEEVLNKKDKKYLCPICKNELIIKNGSINAAHFAHKASCDCDSFSQDMSEWHRDWQNVFPKNNREVVLKLDITKEDYDWYGYNYNFSDINDSDDLMELMDFYQKNPKEGEKILNLEHRADVLACGYVIEFQHSSISKKEFNERNWFYLQCGYRVIWIFDLRDKWEGEQIILLDEEGNNGKYKWNNAYKTFLDFLPQEHKSKYVDNKWQKGDILLFFQLYDEDDRDIDQTIIEQVVWAIDDDDTGDVKFRRFITSYKGPTNKKEFFEAIKKRRL